MAVGHLKPYTATPSARTESELSRSTERCVLATGVHGEPEASGRSAPDDSPDRPSTHDHGRHGRRWYSAGRGGGGPGRHLGQPRLRPRTGGNVVLVRGTNFESGTPVTVDFGAAQARVDKALPRQIEVAAHPAPGRWTSP